MEIDYKSKRYINNKGEDVLRMKSGGTDCLYIHSIKPYEYRCETCGCVDYVKIFLVGYKHLTDICSKCYGKKFEAKDILFPSQKIIYNYIIETAECDSTK